MSDAGPYGNPALLGTNLEPAEDRFGNGEGAYRFNGKSSFATVPNSPSLQSPQSSLTIAVWFKLESKNGNYDINLPLISKGNPKMQYGLNLFRGFGDSHSSIFISSDFSGKDPAYTQHAIDFDKWYFLAATTAEEWIYLYLNGKLIWQSINTKPFLANDAPLEIGKSSATGKYFSGCLDDLRIYKIGLSASEVQQLFKDESGKNFFEEMPLWESSKSKAQSPNEQPENSVPGASTGFKKAIAITEEIEQPTKAVAVDPIDAKSELQKLEEVKQQALKKEAEEKLAAQKQEEERTLALQKEQERKLAIQKLEEEQKAALRKLEEEQKLALQKLELERQQAIKKLEEDRQLALKKISDDTHAPEQTKTTEPQQQSSPNASKSQNNLEAERKIFLQKMEEARKQYEAEQRAKQNVEDAREQAKPAPVSSATNPQKPVSKMQQARVNFDGETSEPIRKIETPVEQPVAYNPPPKHVVPDSRAVLADKKPPVFKCPKDTTIFLPHKRRGIIHFYTPPVATDNLGIDSVWQTLGSKSGCFLQLGVHPFTFYAVDFAGNQTFCTHSVIVRENPELKIIEPPVQLNEVVELGDDTIKYEHKATVKNCKLTVFIYDDGEEDNDTVSIIFNGEVIVSRAKIKLKENGAIKRELDLVPGSENYLIAKAWNTGRYGLNTLRIDAYEGVIENDKKDLKSLKTATSKVLHSKPGTAGGMLLKCEE